MGDNNINILYESKSGKYLRQLIYYTKQMFNYIWKLNNENKSIKEPMVIKSLLNNEWNILHVLKQHYQIDWHLKINNYDALLQRTLIPITYKDPIHISNENKIKEACKEIIDEIYVPIIKEEIFKQINQIKLQQFLYLNKLKNTLSLYYCKYKKQNISNNNNNNTNNNINRVNINNNTDSNNITITEMSNNKLSNQNHMLI